MIKQKKPKFIIKNKWINTCELNKLDITFMLANPTLVEFNLTYPAYIFGKAYFRTDETLTEKLIFNTATLNGAWVMSHMAVIAYISEYIKELESKYDSLILTKIELNHSKKSVYKF